MAAGEGSHLTVGEFAKILRARWKLICGTIAVVVLAAVGYSLLAIPQYQASVRLFVSTPSDGTNTQTYDGGLFAERRVLSYTELLTGDIAAQRTIDKLGLDMTPAQLQEKVEAVVPAETVLIDVTVTDSSPTRARDIANALADEFVVMAARLETPELGQPPNARVVVQQRAELPSSPVNSKTKRMLAIAAVMGALLGVVVAVIRDRMDDSVKSSDALERATGVGLLADIPFDAQRRTTPLILFESDRSAFANAFRELRINLRFLQIAEGPRVLVITSCVPTQGTTMTAVNLSLALADAGHNVVIVDGDLRRPGVATSFDLAGDAAGLSDVLSGAAPLRDSLQETGFAHLTALTSGAIPGDPTDLLESRATADVLGQLGGQFDYVVVDSPSLLVKDAAILSTSAQGVLIVARSGQTTRKQLGDAIHTLRRAGAPLLGSVLSMTRAKKRSKGDDYYRTADPGQGAQKRRGTHQK
ncbi:polysaccharide biosynthesis tyrosine autokinase [Mycolicibacterium tusciae]|uniref:polysaccharide biosynthesis tyrosine autokinase n=1 Tax=Mycolicibacterium tusciae TaxID=75922 RepID=UPI000D1D1384|nr:polysaccharide biosynthesis tyrosine autokinase [Mycolicibacterium tusciae]